MQEEEWIKRVSKVRERAADQSSVLSLTCVFVFPPSPTPGSARVSLTSTFRFQPSTFFSYVDIIPQSSPLCRFPPTAFAVHTCVIRTRVPGERNRTREYHPLAIDSHVSDLSGVDCAIVSEITFGCVLIFFDALYIRAPCLSYFAPATLPGPCVSKRKTVFAARGRNDGMEIPNQSKKETKFRSRGRILIGFAFESHSLSLSFSLSLLSSPLYLSRRAIPFGARHASVTLLNRCPPEREHTKLNEHP